jgi:hypothetical protein
MPGSKFVPRRTRSFAVLLAVVCVICPQLGASASDTATTIDIGKGEIGALPAEFELLPRSEIKQGSWTVVRDDDFRAQRVNGQSGFRRETVDHS